MLSVSSSTHQHSAAMPALRGRLQAESARVGALPVPKWVGGLPHPDLDILGRGSVASCQENWCLFDFSNPASKLCFAGVSLVLPDALRCCTKVNSLNGRESQAFQARVQPLSHISALAKHNLETKATGMSNSQMDWWSTRFLRNILPNKVVTRQRTSSRN